MWTRRLLKARAKAVLRTSYWKAFLVSLILGFAGGQAGGGSINLTMPFRGTGSRGTSGQGGGVGFGLDDRTTMIIIAIAAVIMIFVVLFVLAFRIFLGFPLEVSARQYFKQAAQDDVNMNYLGHAFNKVSYWLIIKAMFYRGLLTILWSLLLLIPGIVKSYSYSMVPYLLTENPHIGTKRAIELSRRMTAGHKFRMWVLDLSFIWWYILGTLALVIGLLFVMPYVNATKAELYVELRRRALEQGICTAEELRLAV